MGSASSSEAIRGINEWGIAGRGSAATGTQKRATEEYGSLTFNEEVQRARLPKDVFRALRRSIARESPSIRRLPTPSRAR